MDTLPDSRSVTHLCKLNCHLCLEVQQLVSEGLCSVNGRAIAKNILFSDNGQIQSQKKQNFQVCLLCIASILVRTVTKKNV